MTQVLSPKQKQKRKVPRHMFFSIIGLEEIASVGAIGYLKSIILCPVSVIL